MTKEIKEILDKCTPFLFGDEVDKLYNYITNLQEYETIIEMEFKREYAKRYLEERRKEEPHLLYPDSDEIYKRYYELKEENKKLKELCDKYEEEHNNEFQCWKRDRKELLDKRDRINKAIDNLENPYFVDCEQQCKDAINILQGSDRK